MVGGGEKIKKKLKTEAISVMSGTHSITSVLPLGWDYFKMFPHNGGKMWKMKAEDENEGQR